MERKIRYEGVIWDSPIWINLIPLSVISLSSVHCVRDFLKFNLWGKILNKLPICDWPINYYNTTQSLASYSCRNPLFTDSPCLEECHNVHFWLWLILPPRTLLKFIQSFFQDDFCKSFHFKVKMKILTENLFSYNVLEMDIEYLKVELNN